MRARLNLAEAGLTEDQWRERWDSARLFLTADGEKDKAWGNETLRWNPDEGWLRGQAARPRSRTWRTGPTAATGCPARSGSNTGVTRLPLRPRPAPCAMTSPVTRYGAAGTCGCVVEDPGAGPAASLDELRPPRDRGGRERGHLAVAVAAPDGNVAGRAVHDPAGAGRAACDRPRRPRPRRRHPAHRDREDAGARAVGHRGPRFQGGPRRGTRAHGEPALTRQARARASAA